MDHSLGKKNFGQIVAGSLKQMLKSTAGMVFIVTILLTLVVNFATGGNFYTAYNIFNIYKSGIIYNHCRIRADVRIAFRRDRPVGGQHRRSVQHDFCHADPYAGRRSVCCHGDRIGGGHRNGRH